MKKKRNVEEESERGGWGRGEKGRRRIKKEKQEEQVTN